VNRRSNGVQMAFKWRSNGVKWREMAFKWREMA